MSDEEKKEKKIKFDFDDDDHGGFANDAEELKGVLSVVSEEIPKLLDQISKALYNPTNADAFGKSVAQFYKQMREAGMDEKQAFEMTDNFMSNFSMGSMLSNMLGGAIDKGMSKNKDDDDDDDDHEHKH
jgi:hypothetical protein